MVFTATATAYTVNFDNQTSKTSTITSDSITIDNETLTVSDADPDATVNLTIERWTLTSKSVHLETNSTASEFTYEARNTRQKYEIYTNNTLETTIRTDENGTVKFTLNQRNATILITIPESIESPYYGAIQSMGAILGFALIVVVIRWLAKVFFPTAPTDKSDYK